MDLTKLSIMSVIIFTLLAFYFSYAEFKYEKDDNTAKKFKKILIYGLIIIVLSIFAILIN